MGKSLCLLFQHNPLFINLHNTLQSRLVAGGHFPGQVVNIYVLWNGNLTMPNG